MTADPKTSLERGLQVLQLEAEAIRTLAGRLGPEFQVAVELILGCKGRVVVTGMGKAGLIGQKISATLASTGTPSLSLHPAEALHGDLGRVRSEDLILALSWSGQTREILQLLPPLKTIGATILAITESDRSGLGRDADAVLPLGPLGEACPLGLAPTVTTTAMLALGDALAMAVLEGRDFTREEFASFHPGGKLGRQLMRIGDIMRKGEQLPLVREDASLGETIAIMTSTPGRPGCGLVVTQDRSLLGIFTDGDLRRLVSEGSLDPKSPVAEHLGSSPTCVREDQLVGEALHIFKDLHVDQLPVLADDKDFLVGLVDVQDLLEIRL